MEDAAAVVVAAVGDKTPLEGKSVALGDERAA
jgi:hypothetical protein